MSTSRTRRANASRPTATPAAPVVTAPTDPLELAVDTLILAVSPSPVPGIYAARTTAIASLRALVGATPEQIADARHEASRGLERVRRVRLEEVWGAARSLVRVAEVHAAGRSSDSMASCSHVLARAAQAEARATGYEEAVADILGALGVSVEGPASWPSV